MGFFKFVVVPGGFWLRDLEAAKGTVVPGALGSQTPSSHGASLVIALSVLGLDSCGLAECLCHRVSLPSESLPDTSWAAWFDLQGLGRGRVHCVHSKGL